MDEGQKVRVRWTNGKGLVLFLCHSLLPWTLPGPTMCSFILENANDSSGSSVLFICTLSARVAVAFLSTHVSLTRRDATWIHVNENRQLTSLLQEVSEIIFLETRIFDVFRGGGALLPVTNLLSKF